MKTTISLLSLFASLRGATWSAGILLATVGCGGTVAPTGVPAKASVDNISDYDSLPSRPTPFTATTGTPVKKVPPPVKALEAEGAKGAAFQRTGSVGDIEPEVPNADRAQAQ